MFHMIIRKMLEVAVQRGDSMSRKQSIRAEIVELLRDKGCIPGNQVVEAFELMTSCNNTRVMEVCVR